MENNLIIFFFPDILPRKKMYKSCFYFCELQHAQYELMHPRSKLSYHVMVNHTNQNKDPFS